MSLKSKSKVDACPCGSNTAYADCCGRWHAGTPAPAPEALMRSRYTAFVQQREAYLLDTWHPRTRPASIDFLPSQKWLGLKIVAASMSTPDAGEVEFIARFRIGGGSAARLHERSRFVREHGAWLYVDGELQD